MSEQTLTKTCLDCGEAKLLADFSPSPRGVAGRNSYCKVCMRERSKASYRKRKAAAGMTVRERPEPTLEGTKRCPDCGMVKSLDEFPRNRADRTGYATYCKPCHNARTRANIQKNHGNTRNYHLVGRYGLTAAQYEAMLSAQRGRCAACWNAPAAHVDHDHVTGRVRGLLCSSCNQALGNARDDIDVLRRLVNYLHASRGVLHAIPIETYQPFGLHLEYVPSVRHGSRS
jgi:hypothetical protein